jgi:hypothetical protein
MQRTLQPAHPLLLWTVWFSLLIGLGFTFRALFPPQLFAPPSAIEEGPVDFLPPGSASRLSGNWLYVMDPRDKPAPWCYATQRVELKLAESAGQLHGQFRSLYQVPANKTPQEIRFDFSGPKSSQAFTWQSGSLKGQIQLRFEQTSLLQTSWVITSASPIAGLSAASVSLSRKSEATHLSHNGI